jgi:hypothetical protein
VLERSHKGSQIVHLRIVHEPRFGTSIRHTTTTPLIENHSKPMT